MATRRAFLRVAGTAAVGAPLLASQAAADHFEHQPDHVTLTYDQGFLETYQPELVLPYKSNQKFLGMYGWVATSTEYDYDWCVYCAEYSHQTGVSSYDSHYGDREWFYVAVDAGDPAKVLYTAWHWYKEETTQFPTAGDTHPVAHVIDPWHHYVLDGSASSGTRPDVVDLGVGDDATKFQGWLDNGLEESLYPGAVVNPASMQARDHWWREDIGPVSLRALRAYVDYVGYALLGDVETDYRSD